MFELLIAVQSIIAAADFEEDRQNGGWKWGRQMGVDGRSTSHFGLIMNVTLET